MLEQRAGSVKTTVVNIKGYDGPPYVYIGRPSRFGNPYVIGVDGTREGVITAYSVYFRKKVDTDPAFRTAIEALRGQTLG